MYLKIALNHSIKIKKNSSYINVNYNHPRSIIKESPIVLRINRISLNKKYENNWIYDEVLQKLDSNKN